jgi:hypothetical protein
MRRRRRCKRNPCHAVSALDSAKVFKKYVLTVRAATSGVFVIRFDRDRNIRARAPIRTPDFPLHCYGPFPE